MNVDHTLDCNWQITRDEKNAEIVFPDGKIVSIPNGEAVEIELLPNCGRFILSDCEVIEEEFAEKRVYRILPDENTQYGEYTQDAISLI